MNDILDVQRDHTIFNSRGAAHYLARRGTCILALIFRAFQWTLFCQESCDHKNITKATTPFDFTGRTTRFCFRMQKKSLS
jgi:23S rRNA (cytosine1962-C5)-methyltransferase